MFALSKLIKPFLWPPGIFVLLFMVVGIGHAVRRRSRPAAACLGIALAMFCFRKLGIPARPAPCGFRTWEGKAYGWPDW